MLIQNTLETIVLSIKKDEQHEQINNKKNDFSILNFSNNEEVIENKIDLILDSNRRKFESEIGRDIVHERRMRKELMENSSSTGEYYVLVREFLLCTNIP